MIQAGLRLPKFAAFMVTAAETATAAALLTWILLNGTNPIHLTTP
jgi:hypothetical protein